MAQRDDRTLLLVQELTRRSNEEARRLRAVEQRLDNLESRVANLESQFLKRSKLQDSKFIEFDVSLKQIGDTTIKLRNDVDKINKQVSKFATKTELKEVERMFELLRPALMK